MGRTRSEFFLSPRGMHVISKLRLETMVMVRIRSPLSTSPVLSQDGWTFGLKWDQSTMVTIPKDGTETIMVTANIPQDAPSGMRASSAFIATSKG
ncbi:MAG: hypothetical protein Ct9H90mP16_21070 [Candidatus Poseidoniales archaeon]|nr:MAG: hypothetical protein Ct9H90mP16_21070 [Candidatus Poseidoniales archaeon]